MTILAGKVEALEYETKRISTRVESVAQDSEQKLREINKKKEALAPPTEGSVQTAGGADADFEKALKAHQEGDYPGAERGFEDFLKKHPKHPLASRAIFWMGDGYMAQKLYKKAISKFQDLIDRFPKSDKRCDSMGKQISAFKELKMEKEAKVFSQVRESECKSN
jgi:tol-pal system protein YbgF